MFNLFFSKKSLLSITGTQQGKKSVRGVADRRQERPGGAPSQGFCIRQLGRRIPPRSTVWRWMTR